MEVLVFGKLQLMIYYIPPRHAHSSEPGLQSNAVLSGWSAPPHSRQILGAGDRMNGGDSRVTDQGSARCVGSGEYAAGASGEQKAELRADLLNPLRAALLRGAKQRVRMRVGRSIRLWLELDLLGEKLVVRVDYSARGLQDWEEKSQRTSTVAYTSPRHLVFCTLNRVSLERLADISRLSLMGRTSNHTRFSSIARAVKRRQRRHTLTEC